MFRFKVDGQSYQLPQTPYEVTYSQGIQIRELEKTFGGINYGYKLNVLKMLSGCDRLDEVVEEEINAIYKGLPLFSGDTGVMISEVIVMNGKRYGLVDLEDDSFKLKHWMDIENLLKNAEDLHSVSSSLAAILYRPIKSVKHSWLTRLINIRLRFIKSKFIKPYACLDYELEKYDLKESDSRVPQIEESFSWGNAISCLAYYMNWKHDLAKRYHLVFPEPTEEEKKKMEEEQEQGIVKPPTMGDIWGAYYQLGLITERNYKEMLEAKQSPLSEFMYYLSYCIQDNEYRKQK